MASSFPGAIDSFTDPLSGSALNSPSHSAQHADLNDAVEKIETYVLNTLGSWVSFTPSWTNVTLGNGTQSAFYSVINKILFVKVELTFGSTTSFGDPVELTLPNSYTAITTSQLMFGTSAFEDTGNATFVGQNYLVSSTKVRPSVQLVNGTYSQVNFTNATRPFTWGNTDVLNLDFMVQVN